MPMPSMDALIQETEKVVTNFRQLSTDEKLGVLWVIYENMGGSITPAAPGAANPQFTQTLLDRVKEMKPEQQLDFMRDLVNRTSTEDTQQYKGFTDDNKLVFWYQLAVLMSEGEVIPVPDNYSPSAAASQVFNEVVALDFNSQITVLREAVIEMGPTA